MCGEQGGRIGGQHKDVPMSSSPSSPTPQPHNFPSSTDLSPKDVMYNAGALLVVFQAGEDGRDRGGGVVRVESADLGVQGVTGLRANGVTCS